MLTIHIDLYLAKGVCIQQYRVGYTLSLLFKYVYTLAITKINIILCYTTDIVCYDGRCKFYHNIVHYSGTPLNGLPSMADTCNIMDNSECPDCISIHFNTFKSSQQRTPRYIPYNGHLFWSRSSLRNSEQPRITDS